MPAPAPAEAPKGTARRDQLLEMQTRVQAKWEASKAFEVDAPAGTWDGGKFMVTFPYPYMNGKLHLGHAFSLTKAEFAAAYQRMLGKKALFPFAFHCTGMPIQAAAFKLKKEYDAYGQPLPNFPASPPEVVESDPDNSAITIGWKAPTSTGGKPLTGFAILVREGVSGEYVEKAKVDATGAEPGAQFSHTVEGLTVGSQYGFQVVTIVDGLPGVPGRKLEKSADGKHPLALLASKKDASKDDKKGGGGGGAPAKKPAAKVQAKTGGMMTQWDILISMGFSPEEAVAFVDPVHWLKVFPPLGKTDLLKLGVGVDWRRAFLTTDYNPYYDSFVRWQFYQLKQGDFIAFGKRPSIFSEADAQPCMDHDRDKGEGVGHQEYVALKILLLEPLPAVLADSPLKDKKIYCLAATLRPETMCGQTNVWILPEGDYGAFAAGPDEVYICAPRAARNMGFQDIFEKNVLASPKQLMSIKGSQLIGAKCKAPLTPYEHVYMLPLTTISMTKGTAIVTSVPSDSPDDYAAFMDLKNPKKREFYGVQAEWVEPYELIEVMECTIDAKELKEGKVKIPETTTRRAAEFMCEQLKVSSQKDVDNLHLAHEVVYNAGFYKGTMVSGEFAGLSVQDAKPKCKAALCASGQAFTYLEPEGLVTPRSTPDVECVVALVDQWYLKYGAHEWQAAVGKHLESLECFNPQVAKAFRDALAWLSDWACSRSFGLGTRIPWDEQFLVESLSDSTIYMAYYLVAHFLQGGVIDGRTVGPSGIKPEQCTNHFWDAIMLGKMGDYEAVNAINKVDMATMKQMRREVEFWYPMDLRVSGRDLIPNHLTMSLYNHAAIWKDNADMWPRGFYCCGLVQVDGEKMSKSKGNFITVEDANTLWGADATRFTCADAGDGILNANYDRKVVNQAILALTTEFEWITDTLNRNQGKAAASKAVSALRPPGAPAVWLDGWFANEMTVIAAAAAKAYDAMRFKEALKTSFYLMQEARDRYRAGTSHVGASEELVRQWAEWQALMMNPITPHWSEAIWEFLGKEGLCVHAKWPVPAVPEDPAITRAGEYLFEVAHTLSASLVKSTQPKKAGKGGAAPEAAEKPNQVSLYVAKAFPRWKEIVLELLRAHYDASTNTVDEKVMKEIIPKHEELNSFNKGKQVPQFAAMVRAEAQGDPKIPEIVPKGAAAFALSMPFDELAVLAENTAYLCASVGLSAVHLFADPSQPMPQPDTFAMAVPGKPTAFFFFSSETTRPEVSSAAPIPPPPEAPPAAA